VIRVYIQLFSYKNVTFIGLSVDNDIKTS